jgi:hypothetical protein
VTGAAIDKNADCYSGPASLFDFYPLQQEIIAWQLLLSSH